MNPCKVCNSELKEEIDKKILAGTNFYELEQWCKVNGLQLARASLLRHANSHLEGYQPRIKGEPAPHPQPLLNFAESSQTGEGGETEGYAERVRSELQQVILNQLSIVRLAQRGYLAGELRNPIDELRGLELLGKTAIGNFLKLGKDSPIEAAGEADKSISEVIAELEELGEVETIQGYLERMGRQSA
jgi:hypothetical protein